MSLFKSLTAVAVLAAATSAANAAVSLAWVEVLPIDPNAFTTPQQDNTTQSAVIPVGLWHTYELKLTTTGGDKFGGGALRASLAALPAGTSFYRNTVIDGDTEQPVNLAGNVLFSTNGSPANPARKYTTGVNYPGNPTTTSLLGSLRADGSQGPASEIVEPNGLNGQGDSDDQLLSVVWGNASPPVVTDGTFTIARLTIDAAADPLGVNIIGQGSVAATIVAGRAGADVPIPALIVGIPEPTMGFALAGLGLLGLRRRK